MTDFVAFEGIVEPLLWGKATYTILRVPRDIEDALGGAKRVEGEIAEHPVNLGLTRAPVVDGAFLWAGESLLRRIGIAVGERVEVRLRPAAPDLVDIAADVTAALCSGGLTDRWEALTAGKQRGLLYQVNIAKTAATRAKRITKLVQSLTEDSVS